MPRKQNPVPTLRHAAKQLGYVKLDGRFVYLGPSPEGQVEAPAPVWEAYQRAVSEWRARGQAPAVPVGRPGEQQPVSVGPEPPHANIVKSRGSWPRSIVTCRSRSAMRLHRTSRMPQAACATPRRSGAATRSWRPS